MNRPGGLYRSTSEISLSNGDYSRSSNTSRSDSEHSQFGELLGKEISHGRRSGKPSEPKDHIGEIVEASSKANTESVPDYAAQLRSSTPISDDDDKKSGRKPSDRDSGSQRSGDRYSTRDRDGSSRDRDDGRSGKPSKHKDHIGETVEASPKLGKSEKKDKGGFGFSSFKMPNFSGPNFGGGK